MKRLEVIIVNHWWHDPLFIALISAILTGIIFALVLEYHNRYLEKKDVLVSLNSELRQNYNTLQKIQNISAMNNIPAGYIEAARKDMPWNQDLTDKELALDNFKNQPVDKRIATDCWSKLQYLVAKYPNEYSQYGELYGLLISIIRYSKIKSKEINNANIAEITMAGQFGAIRSNSELFIRKHEQYFPNK